MAGKGDRNRVDNHEQFREHHDEVFSKFTFREYSMMHNQESYLKLFWNKLQEDDKLQRTFFGDIKEYEELERFFDSAWLYMGFQGKTLVGGVWFNEFTQSGCKVHYSSFKGYNARKATPHIKALLQNILDFSENDAYIINADTPYKGVTRLYKGLGFNNWEKVGDRYIGSISK